jgi:RNA 2',3'-cyclic 3'-phosphodiesterase
MRLFFAVEVPNPLQLALAERSRALAGDLRPVQVGQIHLTLKFVGEVDDAVVPAVIEAAGAAVGGPRFAVDLRGGGFFPSSRRPKVAWVGLVGDQGRLDEIAAAIDRALVPLGVPAEDRPFRPHVTLARIRGRVPPETVAAVEALGELGRVEVDEVVLFRSELGPRGATHTLLHHFPLG